MTKLVQQRLLVGPEALGGPVLGSARLLEAIGEERKIVLRGLELILQEIALRGDGLGFGVGTGYVSLQSGVARLELLQAPARP